MTKFVSTYILIGESLQRMLLETEVHGAPAQARIPTKSLLFSPPAQPQFRQGQASGLP
jgi:hypothetical protein